MPRGVTYPMINQLLRLIAAEKGTSEACFWYLESVIARESCSDGVLVSTELSDRPPWSLWTVGSKHRFLHWKALGRGTRAKCESSIPISEQRPC